MSIDPKIRFLIGLMVTFAIGVSQGTVVLTNAIPDMWIKPVVAWCGILAFVGSAAQTTISALGISTQSRISAAASLPEVQKIVTTEAVANTPQFVANDKVVSKP